ncbi:MAG: rod shape-determining protein MreC [Candidatus Kerfeldbacteria bacterium]|nr:rod shape-determining protein MreC [Candidatus Kerfeldbacteria bacterium]
MKFLLKSRLGIITVAVISIGLLITTQRLGVLRPVENIVSTALRPIQEFLVTSSLKIQNISTYFTNLENLQKDNEQLREEIAALTNKNLKLQNTIDDADDIREQLEFINSNDIQTVNGKIIGRASDEYLRTVIINKGDADGIKIGNPVITGSGILYGRVIDTNRSISKVLLLNDNQSELSVIVSNDARSPGILKGQFGLSLIMQLIPQSDTISIGDLVITSGLEESIPSDLLIGKISEVRKQDGQLFQEATIEPLIDYQTVRVVSIITPAYAQE